MYESRRNPPLPRIRFIQRLTVHVAGVIHLLVGSLLIGMIGYCYFENLDWRDAFLNSSMLLGGMGPVDAPVTDGGKVFAGLYAIYAGLVFIVAAGLVLLPVLHRLLHKFHWDDSGSAESSSSPPELSLVTSGDSSLPAACAQPVHHLNAARYRILP